ncbi:hypothetical protein V8B55DRAFT_1551908 [Mucor lusitanicus]
MHIWLHTHNHVDTQRVPRQVTFTFALATRHVVCLHVDRHLCTGNIQLNMLQLFTVKIHSMRIHHAHHFIYSTPELINLAFHPYSSSGSTLFESRDGPRKCLRLSVSTK